MSRDNKLCLILVISVLMSVFFTSACQSREISQPVSLSEDTKTEEQVKEEPITSTLETIAPLAPTIDEKGLSSGLATLLSYVPAAWADQHIPGFFGPTIYLLDIAQMRDELKIPPITGSDSRKDKLKLILGLNTQSLTWIPTGIEPTSSAAFEEWGWDIADITQVLYLVDYKTSIILGKFGRSEIGEKLQDKGYTATQIGDLSLFSSKDSKIQFALRPDVLIISAAEKDTQVIELVATEVATNQLPGLQTHSAVKPVLEYFGGIWGAVLAPSPDWATFNANTLIEADKSIPPDIVEALKKKYGTKDLVEPLPWDFMAITFRQADKETQLDFIYHYSSNKEAQKDVGLVQTTLTEMPSTRSRGATWADFMTLGSINVKESVLVAHARTENKELIGKAIESRDDWAFIPAR